ncbi:hypothetical protein CrLKS4_g13 [Cylindrospermopsis phage Cr-LKS4]|nr:hypothetical protein CrLKS4_g13 [Cylindrospermopsis phage Cr-LKS4]
MSSKIAIKDKPAQTLDSIGAKLSRVFDATAVSSLSLNGNNVTQWNNIAPNAGSGTNLTQPTAANQPVYDRINRRISVGGNTSKFLNFNGFSAGFNGSIYIGTTSGIYAYDITIPSGSPDSFQWGRRETGNSTVGVIVTGIVICQTLNQVEESILNRWFAARGSIGFINYSRIGVTSLNDRFATGTQFYEINLHWYVTNIKYVFNTIGITAFSQGFYYNRFLVSMPFVDTSAVQFTNVWNGCESLVNFPSINTVTANNFYATWNRALLSQLSLDNILISIAAGLSNNPSKNLFNTGYLGNDSTFGSVAATPTTINRRANESDWQPWETANNTALSGTALKNINVTYLSDTPNAVTYNFSAGISGQQARLWMIAFSAANSKNPTWNFTTAIPSLSTTPTRVYLLATRATTVSGVGILAPTTGSGNATAFNLVRNETPHGLGSVQGFTEEDSSNSGLMFSGFTAGTYTVFVGTTQGYYSFLVTLAASKTYVWQGEQSGVINLMIMSGSVTSGTLFNQVIDRLNYYGAMLLKTAVTDATQFKDFTLSTTVTGDHEAAFFSFYRMQYVGNHNTIDASQSILWSSNSSANAASGVSPVLRSLVENTVAPTFTRVTLGGASINTINLTNAPLLLAGNSTTTFHIGTTSNRYSITPNLTGNYQALNYFWTGSWSDTGVRAIIQTANTTAPTNLTSLFDGLGVGSGTNATAATVVYPRYTTPFADQPLQSRTISGVSGTNITLNSSVTLNANTQYNLIVGTETRQITTATPAMTSSITIDTAFTSTPSVNTAAYVSAINLSNKLTNFTPTTYTTPTITTVGANFSGYHGGVLAPNGRIYGMPYSGIPVLEITPLPGGGATVTTVGANFSGYHGGVLAPNGRIYGMPYSGIPVLEITPLPGGGATVTTVGANFSGYHGGVLAPNGRIYGMPYSGIPVLEITPLPGGGATVTTVGANFSGYFGGVLAPNGRIYGIPLSDRPVLEITPLPGGGATVTTVGANFSGYVGGVLAPNGRIYGMPYSGIPVLEITPLPGGGATVTTVGANFSGYVGGVLAPNGRIYGMPYSGIPVLEITPLPGGGATVTTVGANFSGYVGGVLAPNGRIYGIPYSGIPVLEINVGAPSDWVNSSRDFLLHGSLNKF